MDCLAQMQQPHLARLGRTQAPRPASRPQPHVVCSASNSNRKAVQASAKAAVDSTPLSPNSNLAAGRRGPQGEVR